MRAARYGACLIAVVALAAEVFGQTLPLVPSEDPPDVLKAKAEAEQKTMQDALKKAAVAWQAAGEPPLMIICGMPWKIARGEVLKASVELDGKKQDGQSTTLDTEPGPTAALPGRAAGSLAPFGRIGTDLTFTDPYGFAQGVTSGVKRIFQKANVNNWVDTDSIIEHRMRTINALQQAGEREMLASIFSESGAGLALYVRIDPVLPGPQDPPTKRPKVRVTVDVKQPETGRSVYTESFVGWIESGSKFVDRHSTELVRILADGIADYYSGRITGQRHLAKIKGADVELITRLKESCKTRLPAMKLFQIRQVSSIGGVPVANLEMRFAGDAFELIAALQRVLREDFQLEASIADSVDGAIALSLHPAAQKPTAPRFRWEVLMTPDHPQRSAILTELKGKYVAEGKPSIAVIVNRELAEAEKGGISDAELKNAGLDAKVVETSRLVTLNPPNTGSTNDRAALDTRKMQNLLIDEFLNQYEFRPKDPQMSQQLLAEAAHRQGSLFEDRQMQSLMLQLKGVDIAVRGIGVRLETPKPHYEYTFDVVNCKNGNLLATATESVDAQAFVGGADPLQRLAKQVTARICDQLLKRWSPPRRFHVLVHNAASQANVLAVMDAFETELKPRVGRADFVRHTVASKSGLGEFDVEWDGDYRSILDAVEAKKGALSFDLEAKDTDSSTLNVRIKDGLAVASTSTR